MVFDNGNEFKIALNKRQEKLLDEIVYTNLANNSGDTVKFREKDNYDNKYILQFCVIKNKYVKAELISNGIVYYTDNAFMGTGETPKGFTIKKC